ncbi:prokineticin receptor 2-like [Megalops cyprinoides]|uniref:prokineticin receptor 2-like n=1 Tax=Megalops cyprinoides TaxID=118141 RepID=UPI001865127A|nr:prokineticin receptor 2-like [Megalops cyprinoides]
MEDPCPGLADYFDPQAPAGNQSGWNASCDYAYVLGGGALETGDRAHLTARVFIGVALAGIMLICGVGNGLFVATLVGCRKLRSVTNLLIANLAVSDLLVALVCCPFEMHYYVVRELSWSFGPLLCSAVTYLRSVSLYVSTDALLAIAMDRYLVIVHPLKPRMSSQRACCVLAAIWLLSLLVALPSAYFSTQTMFGSFHESAGHKTYCVQIWTADKAALYKSYFLFLFVAQFLLPVLIMLGCYSRICRELWFKDLPGVQTEQIRGRLKARRKTVLVLLGILVTYILCWTPYYSYSIIRDFFPGMLLRVTHSVSLYYLVECIAMSNSVINTLFFILAKNRSGRYIRRALLRRCPPRPRPQTPERTTLDHHSTAPPTSH